MTKKLYRSGKEKMLAGVAGGLADYFEVDVTLVRLIILITLLPGIGFLAYLAAWIIIPLNPEHGSHAVARQDYCGEEKPPVVEAVDMEKNQRREKNRQLAGMLLIVLGGMFFANQLFTWFRWDRMWPLVLIMLGVLILVRGNNGGSRG